MSHSRRHLPSSPPAHRFASAGLFLLLLCGCAHHRAAEANRKAASANSEVLQLNETAQTELAQAGPFLPTGAEHAAKAQEALASQVIVAVKQQKYIEEQYAINQWWETKWHDSLVAGMFWRWLAWIIGSLTLAAIVFFIVGIKFEWPLDLMKWVFRKK